MNKATDNEYKWWFGKLGFCFNAVAVILFGKLNMKVCKWLTKDENYKYSNEHEDALINKIYYFNFINAYISNYLLAYWSNNFGGIAQNLMIILIFKQVIMNVWEYVEDKYGTGRRVDKIKDNFAGRIREEKDDIKRLDMQMHSRVE